MPLEIDIPRQAAYAPIPAARLNAIIDALGTLGRYFGDGLVEGYAPDTSPRQRIPEVFFGTVDNQAGGAGPLYYVRRAVIDPQRAGGGVVKLKAETVTSGPLNVLAVNLVELLDGVNQLGTHNVANGQPVSVFSYASRGGPRVYAFTHVPIRPVLVKVMGNDASGGRYAAAVMDGTSNAYLTSGALHYTGGFTAAGTANALFLNTFEQGSSAHLLAANAYAVGFVVGKTNEAPPRWIVAGQALPPGIAFAVALTQTGGSAGNATTQCSFVYTAALGGNTLGTGLSPNWAGRASVGPMTAASKGLGSYDASGNFTLEIAYETPGAGACGS